MAGEQNLDSAVQKFASCGIVRTDGLRPESAAMTVEASRKYAGVIEDHQVVGPQELREIPKLQVSQTAIAAIEMKEPGGGAIRQRLLGDLVLGQIVMEFGHKHAIDYRARVREPRKSVRGAAATKTLRKIGPFG